MRWKLVGCVLAAGLLTACASVDSSASRTDPDARARARMVRNFDPGARDAIADELRAAEMRYASGDVDDATWTVTEIYQETGDARAAEVLGKFALSEGRFGAAEGHFEDALEDAFDDEQLARLDDLGRLAGGFRAYERGALAEAERLWSAIREPSVRSALAQARTPVRDEPRGVVRGGVR